MNPWHAWRLRATLRRLTAHARQEGGEPPPDLLARLRAEIPPDLAPPLEAPRGRQPEPERVREGWRPRWALAAASLALVATAGLVALRVERNEASLPRTSAATLAGAARANLAAPRGAARGDAGSPVAANAPVATSPGAASPAATSPAAVVASAAPARAAGVPAPGTPEASRHAMGSLAAAPGEPPARMVGAVAKAAPPGEAARDSLRAAGTAPVAPSPAAPQSAVLGAQPAAAPVPPPPMSAPMPLMAPTAPTVPMAAMPPLSPPARLARREAPRPLRSTFGAGTGTAAYDLLRDDLLSAGRLPAPGTLRLDQLANAFAPQTAAPAPSLAVAAPARARAARREGSAPGAAGLEVEGARLPATGSVYLLSLTAHGLAAPIPADAVEVDFDPAVVLSAWRVGATVASGSATALYEIELAVEGTWMPPVAAPAPSAPPPSAADDLVLATVRAASLPRRVVRVGDLRSEWERASASLRLQGLALRLGEIASARPTPAPTRWLQLRAEAAALVAELPADPRAAELRRLVERAVELAGLPPARPSP